MYYSNLIKWYKENKYMVWIIPFIISVIVGLEIKYSDLFTNGFKFSLNGRDLLIFNFSGLDITITPVILKLFIILGFSLMFSVLINLRKKKK